jgi:Ca-activated chloride channel family protein
MKTEMISTSTTRALSSAARLAQKSNLQLPVSGSRSPGLRQLRTLWTVASLLVTSAAAAHGAGVLTPTAATDQPIRMVDHHVAVTINNGFAQTEVTQSFSNPNDHELEAIYRFPLPQKASLSEVTVFLGEKEINGEVLAKDNARTIYEEEKAAGNESGLAEKNGIQAFEFRVFPVRPGEETRLRLVYYQPLEIDSGIGRYLYPLEKGGTEDAAAANFWAGVNEKVDGTFSAGIELKSSWPIEDVRAPGFEGVAVTEKLDVGHHRLRIEQKDVSLDHDLVVYYRLKDDLPGRVEVIAHRADPDKPGTYMMVVTPGLDLKPIDSGADYVYVLDTSGSMGGKIHTVTDGVTKALGKMNDRDRYKIIEFNSNAREVTSGWTVATAENIEASIQQVHGLHVTGGTNLYDGMTLALNDLNDDRATSLVLVTDGVTNTGEVAPERFYQLMKAHDIRVFGFVIGNSAHWPLMRTICEASGGFYSGVSNADDIVGRVLQAKEKIVHECLHDATLKIGGVRTYDNGEALLGKVYRGQQLVIFGRYEKGGRAEMSLQARLTGEDKTYETDFEFPEIATDNPEIERLWALSQIEQIEFKRNAGLVPDTEGAHAIRDLGLEYQLVTDETSMVVLSDESFERRMIERKNVKRVAVERQAQAARSSQPAGNYQVDAHRPLTSGKTHRSFGGGGAFSPAGSALMLLLLGAGAFATRKPKTA